MANVDVEVAGEQDTLTENGPNVHKQEQNTDNADAIESASDSLPTTPNASRDGLRRTSGRGKIANLRAAFEKRDEGPSNHTSPGPTPRRVASRDQEANNTFLREQHAQEIAKLRAEHEAALAEVKAQERETAVAETTAQQQQERQTAVAEATGQQQQEIARLKDELEKEMELRHGYEEKCTALEDRIDALEVELSTQAAHHNTDIDLQNNEKAQAQEEVLELQRQILDLKRTIAFATRIENEVSDSTFTTEFQNLYHETQNWIANNFRRIKVDKSPEAMVARLESIAEPKQLDYLRPIYSNFDSSIKISAFQATAVCYMMEIWDEPLLFGLPTQQDYRKGLRRAMETLPSVLPPAIFNKWRETTLDALRQAAGFIESMESAVASLAEMICITLNTLADAESSDAQLASLNAIVKRAVTLSHLFKAQRARYQFRLPPAGEVFAVDTMEDISVDAETVDGRVVQCATFPSVVKLGDENGDNDETSNVVVKAKVLLHNG